MFGFWSIQGFFLFAMDQECKKLPLFVIFLFWGSAYGFKGGDSNSPQPSDNTFSPSTVQSSVSEVPVTGILPEEVGSRFFTNRPLKRLNSLQFVKGHVSSRHESTSHSQSSPGTSFQGEAAGLGSFVDLSLQSQETSSHLLPSPVEVSNQSTNGQSTPSLFVVGFESSSDPQSTGPVSPLETQGGLSHSILSTQTLGSASTSQGSSEPEWSGSSEQLIPTQVESGSYSGVSQSLSTSSQHSPVYLLYRQFDALPVGVSRQSTNSQSSPSVSTSTQSRSGTIISSHFFPVQGGRNTSSLSLKPQGSLSLYAPVSPTKYVGVPMSSHPAVYSQSTSSSGAQFGASTGFASQGMSSTYSGSVQPQGTASQFAPGSLSSYPSVSLSSPQGAASQSAIVQSSRKQFTSTFTGSSGTQEGFSMPLTLQGSTTYRGSLQPQGTTSQFAPGSLSSYPSVSLSSPQGAASQSATAQSSRKQFTSSYGTQSGSSLPFTLQGSTTYRGSLQPQGTTSQFAPGSPSSSQGAASQSATVQSSQKQFTSTYTGSSGTQEGSSMPLTLQGSTTYGESLQPQGTTSQFASASPSSYNCHCVSLSSPQGVASQLSQALQSYSVSQSQKSPRVQPSQGIQTPGATASRDSSLSLSSPMQSRFSSLSSAGGSSSGDSGQFVSAQGGSTSYGGFSLHSQSLASKYTPGSNAYAKLGSSPLAVSTQSTSDQRSNGLYSSDSLRTQGLHMVKRPSRLSYQAPSDSPSSNKISKSFVTLQRPAGSNLAPSLGLSAQAPSVMFSGILQTAQPLRGSDV